MPSFSPVVSLVTNGTQSNCCHPVQPRRYTSPTQCTKIHYTHPHSTPSCVCVRVYVDTTLTLPAYSRVCGPSINCRQMKMASKQLPTQHFALSGVSLLHTSHAVMNPMSDLCWVYQQNSVAIMRAANTPETKKSQVTKRYSTEHPYLLC